MADLFQCFRRWRRELQGRQKRREKKEVVTFTTDKLVHVPDLARDVRGDDVETTPKIVQHPLSQQVVRDDPLTLDCRASGSPQPTVEWFRDGKPVRTAPADPTSHRILLPGGSLFFLRAMQNKREQDAGTYWCVASNDAGVARSNNATLDIACESYKVLLSLFSVIVARP